MPSNPFAAPGDWLRCALHAHTTNSDGGMAPVELVAHYEEAGFDVLAITDHLIRTDWPSTERLLVVPSAELHPRPDERGHDPHVLALGVEADPSGLREPRLGLEETIAWALEHGGVPYLAHPYWSGLRSADFEGYEGLVGLEVYNATCQLQLARGLSAAHWDEVLETGRLLHAIACDDCHDPGEDSGLAWVWARCEERSQEDVLAALREGRFYSSTGPIVRGVTLRADSVEVRCDGAASITLFCGGKRGARVEVGKLGYRYARGRILEESAEGAILAASLDRPERAPYGRIEVTDHLGRTAWTNPLWI